MLRPRPHPIPASRGSVTSFPGHVCGKPPLDSSGESPLALAGNGDVFAAPGTRAFLAAARHRAGNFVGIDTAIGGGGSKFPRLAVGAGSIGAAFLAPGEALVDAVAVGLVGDDEDAAVGGSSRGDDEEPAGQKC